MNSNADLMSQTSAAPHVETKEPLEVAVLIVTGAMTLPLKCKIGSLASEARFIRTNEQRLIRRARRQRAKGLADATSMSNYQSIKSHRCMVVRREARYSQLAYAFLRGVPYKTVEVYCRPDNLPKWSAVEAIAARFAGGMRPQDIKQQFAEWISDDKDPSPGHSV